ncbi:AraC family transcriptional regulator [Nocardia caishijiensis]|uniref:AraC family transcriptional regulator n=1 Tax=Nocardia caishijiensis TaxID=184756 RepID=A0ABQ6YR61_9NOCA|nr:AraC family transcriptional regulator [Nocardia caishijiensis]KAF0848312.1 AraC family transcriptional regulator [Nocardia caishijiensis]
MVNGPAMVEFSTPYARGAEVDQWAALMEQTYFPLAFTPICDGPVFGKVSSGALPGATDFSLTVLTGRNHRYLRTKTHVARAAEEYLLVSIQVAGEARLTQSDRSVLLKPGQMTILDASLPSLWDDAVAYKQVLVRIPAGTLRQRPGLSGVSIPAAVAIESDSPAGVVATYFRDLARIRERAPAQAEVLAASALDLLASAVLLTAGIVPVDINSDALSRERVMTFLRHNHTVSDLTAGDIAAACHISRRTLFRLFGGPGRTLNATLRGLRLDHAKRLLLAHPSRSCAAIAFESGFASERTFYRVFAQETGLTPGEYREGG